MASRGLGLTIRTNLSPSFVRPLSQRRTLICAGGYVRAHAIAPRKTLGGPSLLLSRGVKTVDFAGHKETVYGRHTSQLVVCPKAHFKPEREDWPRDKLLVRLNFLPFLTIPRRYWSTIRKKAHYRNI